MSYGKSIDFLFNQMRNGTGSLAGGTAEFYYAGTTSFKNIYLDRNLTQIAANPYTLSADGTAELFGDGLYRIVFKDSSDVTVYDYDDVVVVDNSDILESITLNERELFYEMTLGNVQFKKCYRDVLDAADTFNLGGSPIAQYSALDYSLYGQNGSTAITPELIESGTYERAYLYAQADDTALLTYEYSIDGGSTWTTFTDYINVSFSSLRVKITWGGPGKLFSYGLFYDYYGALTVVPTGIYSSLGYSSIEDALVDIGTASAVLRIESGIRVGDSPKTIPSNVETQVVKTGMINLDQDLTIEGSFECGLFQCFSGAGSVVFGDGSIRFYEPVWFGSTDQPPIVNGFAVGIITKNISPAVGQPVGWICTVAGAPGTWAAEANL